MSKPEALEIVLELAEAWIDEYAFSEPDGGVRVWEAINLLRSNAHSEVDERILTGLTPEGRDMVKRVLKSTGMVITVRPADGVVE